MPLTQEEVGKEPLVVVVADHLEQVLAEGLGERQQRRWLEQPSKRWRRQPDTWEQRQAGA